MTPIALIALVVAIVCEVLATVSLRMAGTVGGWWWGGVVGGYVVAFSALGEALAEGMPLGVAYGIWAACGVALTAIISRIFFKEPLTWVMGLGIVLIMGGVLLIETGAAH